MSHTLARCLSVTQTRQWAASVGVAIWVPEEQAPGAGIAYRSYAAP